MNRVCLDAGVAAKWVLSNKEILLPEALELAHRSRSGDLKFIVPDLFWTELGSVLCESVRRGRFPESLALEAINRIATLPISTIASLPLLTDAFEIAASYGRSLRDSIYIAAAVQSKTQLITADERLANATAAHLPVKWLGALA